MKVIMEFTNRGSTALFHRLRKDGMDVGNLLQSSEMSGVNCKIIHQKDDL